jgi:shikimate dehydrogenase
VREQTITGHTQVFGLVGHPVRHSFSPAIYNTLFARFEIDAVYLAFDIHPDQADRVAEMIRVMGLVGVNLTVPFKERILGGLDGLTAAAQEAGAVNVVTHLDGALMGYNTDGEGFVRSLSEEGGPDPAGLHAVILGAGGAARAVASGLLDRGAAGITFLNRTIPRAEEAASALQSGFPSAVFDVEPLTAEGFSSAISETQLVVNCTSGPAAEAVAGLNPSLLRGGSSWVDINYWMADPPGREACLKAGVRFHDGLGMLAHQGALAFELFTGYPVTGSEIRAVLGSSK